MATMEPLAASGMVGRKIDPAASEGSTLTDLLKSRTQSQPLGPVMSSVAPPMAPAPSAGPAIQPPAQLPAPSADAPDPRQQYHDQQNAQHREQIRTADFQDRNRDGTDDRDQPSTPTPPGQSPQAPAFNPLGTSTYMQQFGPQNTIRATRITGGDAPTADSRAVDQARARASGALPDVDRGALAGDILSQLIERSNPAFQNELRTVNQRAAAGGRLGAGMTTTELGDVTSNRQRYITDAARQLSSEAAGLTLEDSLAKGRYGLDQLSELRGLEGQRFGQGVTSREELRGERGYENQMARDARSDEIERILLEEGLLDSSFNRDQDRLDLLGRYGFGGSDPSNVLMQASGNTSAQAGGGGDLLAELLYSQASRRS